MASLWKAKSGAVRAGGGLSTAVARGEITHAASGTQIKSVRADRHRHLRSSKFAPPWRGVVASPSGSTLVCERVSCLERIGRGAVAPRGGRLAQEVTGFATHMGLIREVPPIDAGRRDGRRQSTVTGPPPILLSPQRGFHEVVQTKLAASLVLPLPVQCARLGHAQSGRVMSTLADASSFTYLVAINRSGAAPPSTQRSSGST